MVIKDYCGRDIFPGTQTERILTSILVELRKLNKLDEPEIVKEIKVEKPKRTRKKKEVKGSAV